MAESTIGDRGEGDATTAGLVGEREEGGMMAALLYASTILLMSTLPFDADIEDGWAAVGAGSGRYIPYVMVVECTLWLSSDKGTKSDFKIAE